MAPVAPTKQNKNKTKSNPIKLYGVFSSQSDNAASSRQIKIQKNIKIKAPPQKALHSSPQLRG